MRQTMNGYSESSNLGTYRINEERLNTMQSNLQEKRICKKPKRFRSAFTTEQIDSLEQQYKMFPYIDRVQRKEVAALLKMEERSVKIWFQNRRMREKKEIHKECDDETSNPLEFGKDQLHNGHAVMPSTNDQHSYSLSLLSSTNIGAKTNEVQHKQKLIYKPELGTKLNVEPKGFHQNANYYREASNQKHLSPYFHLQTANSTTKPFPIDIRNKNVPSTPEYNTHTSADFSINLYKKYKEKSGSTNAAMYDNTGNEAQKAKKNVSKQTSKKNTKHFSPANFSANKKPKLSYQLPPKQQKQVNLNNPAYYPIMPTVYAPPFMSSGGVLWKPVNFMPVMTTDGPPMTIPNHLEPAQEQSQNCKCNCHENTQQVPINLPPSLQNPYTQYVFTVPYQHPSSKF